MIGCFGATVCFTCRLVSTAAGHYCLYCTYVWTEVKSPQSKPPPPSSCLSTSLQSHSPPSPCQSPCQYPIRTQQRRQPYSSVTTPAAPWSPPPPSSPPPLQTPASCRHSNHLCRGTPCRQGYHSDQPAQVRHTAGLLWWKLCLYDAAWWWVCKSMISGIFREINSALIDPNCLCEIFHLLS